MTNLTLDNWPKKLANIFMVPLSDRNMCIISEFISDLLTLQKQALKDEAVKRIEEERDGDRPMTEQNHLSGVSEPKHAIQRLKLENLWRYSSLITEFTKQFDFGIDNNREVIKFIIGVLNAQKNEAVKRIEELSLLQNHRFSDGLDEAIEVIRNL